MPTVKPRIQVTLTPHQYEVIKAVTATSGQSMSTFLAELVELSMPTFEKMAHAFATIRDAQRLEKERLAKSLEQAHDRIEPLAHQALAEFGRMVDVIEAAAESPSRSGARKADSVAAGDAGASRSGAGAAKSPRPVTRGLRNVTERGSLKRDAASDKAGRQVVRKGGV